MRSAASRRSRATAAVVPRNFRKVEFVLLLLAFALVVNAALLASNLVHTRRSSAVETLQPDAQIDSAKCEPVQLCDDGNSRPFSDPWLIVGIPSFPRQTEEGKGYLARTLGSLAHELPSRPTDALFGKIKVVVMNNMPGKHAEFELARRDFSGRFKGGVFEFVDNPARPYASRKEIPGDANHPGSRVQDQTRDVVELLRNVAGRSAYYLFMEDDFVTCPYTFQALSYFIEKANRYAVDWAALRVSYGLCGVVLKGHDLATLASYMSKHLSRRPPDHLMVEWMARETAESYLKERRNLAFRYNLLEHFGTVSSLRDVKQTTFPLCYELLTYPTNFEVEAFNPQDCPEDDVWPCRLQGIEELDKTSLLLLPRK